MAGKANLPIGIEDFGRIRRDGFYYVDKTGLIKDLLENIAYVNLFTRPRRFGKTLNMSMLKYFFEAGSDRELFDGLEISREKGLCDNTGT
ncbi:MAG: AAA family ATPase [Lachnospiraceae bacterium]|nr:AAA family ATPase [Lachnospiraceae bacterium]